MCHSTFGPFHLWLMCLFPLSFFCMFLSFSLNCTNLTFLHVVLLNDSCLSTSDSFAWIFSFRMWFLCIILSFSFAIPSHDSFIFTCDFAPHYSFDVILLHDSCLFILFHSNDSCLFTCYSSFHMIRLFQHVILSYNLFIVFFFISFSFYMWFFRMIHLPSHVNCSCFIFFTHFIFRSVFSHG